MASHLQVLDLDNFVSMEHLKSSTDDETLKHVKGLILNKLKNQFSQMTKTEVLLKKGLMTGELITSDRLHTRTVHWFSDRICMVQRRQPRPGRRCEWT